MLKFLLLGRLVGAPAASLQLAGSADHNCAKCLSVKLGGEFRRHFTTGREPTHIKVIGARSPIASSLAMGLPWSRTCDGALSTQHGQSPSSVHNADRLWSSAVATRGLVRGS